MSEHGEYGVPYQQLSAFANSLFGYLYFHLDMHGYRVNSSEHFKEVIGRAVFLMRKNTYKFNKDVLDSCGYGVDRLALCQKICSSYPNDDYFKKLYYVSTFILEMMYWWHTHSDAADLSMGPSLWITIFRNNFESEFETHGGWLGMADAGNVCCELLPNEILPGETILPTYFQAVVSAVGEIITPSEDVDMGEVLASFDNFNFGPMEIDDASVDEAAQVSKSEEKTEEEQPVKVAQVEEPKQETKQKQPRKVIQVEESKEEIKENQPAEVDCRPSPHSLALGENVSQTKDPCEGTSEKSGEGSRTTRKRRHYTPPKSDSDTEPHSLSPSKAKVDRK